jgi:hypothetical protein
VRTPIRIVVSGDALALAALAACNRRDSGVICYDITLPGTVVYLPPIDLLVRDAFGRGQALGDTAVTYHGTDSLVSPGMDTLHLRAGFTQGGTYTVRVRRRFYQDAIVPGVQVASDACGRAVSSPVAVMLQLAPRAPPLRAVQVVGADFLYAPGVQRQLAARFDADPTPTAVAWRSSDTTLARIDAAGLVTARCSTTGGSVTVTALATADTLVHGSATFGVASVRSCP